MITFISIHRGESTRKAKVVAASSNPILVAEVATWLLQEGEADASDDPVLSTLHDSRMQALRLIKTGGYDGD